MIIPQYTIGHFLHIKDPKISFTFGEHTYFEMEGISIMYNTLTGERNYNQTWITDWSPVSTMFKHTITIPDPEDFDATTRADVPYKSITYNGEVIYEERFTIIKKMVNDTLPMYMLVGDYKLNPFGGSRSSVLEPKYTPLVDKKGNKVTQYRYDNHYRPKLIEKWKPLPKSPDYIE